MGAYIIITCGSMERSIKGISVMGASCIATEMYGREKCVCRSSEHRRCIAAGVAGPENRHGSITEKGLRP